MPGLALILLAVYGIVALGLRVAVQVRRTGSTGISGISGEPGSAEWAAGTCLVLAVCLLVAGPVLSVIEVLEPLDVLEGTVANVAGACLAVAGILATSLAQFAMGDAWRIGVGEGERTDLVVGGPFSVVRNPIYAAMIPAFAGIALLAPSAVTLAGTLLLITALELQTRLVEEPHLLRVHGDAYAEYAASVVRFFPGVGLLRRGCR